jgi:hypothetical protein
MASPEHLLMDTIQAHRDRLLSEVCGRLEKLSQSRYEVIPFERHLEREEALLTALLQGLAGPDPSAFTGFIERIAGQRSREGYSLDEVQQALNIFEEELWSILIETQPVTPELVAMLSLGNRLFGRAKDHLAQIYLHRTQNMQSELDDLREKFYDYSHKSDKPSGRED